MSTSTERFLKVGVILPGKAGTFFGAKHVGVWDKVTNQVLELTNREGTNKIEIKTPTFDQFRTDKDGTKKDVFPEDVNNQKLHESAIFELWEKIVKRWNNKELSEHEYEVVPGDRQSSCETLAEEVMTGIPSSPQADQIRGTIFEEIAKFARVASHSSPSVSGRYGG